MTTLAPSARAPRSSARQRDPSAVVELRQYTLKPGQRDTLIELFETNFIESQQAAGMSLIGQFRDLDDANRFVWLRGFADMAQRGAALTEFYGGETWKTHRSAANATMVDSDDVLLLRPASPFGGCLWPAPAAGSTRGAGVVLAHIHHLCDSRPDDFIECFERLWQPLLWNASVQVLASYVSETAPNSFAALPVRADARVFVWLSRHADVRQAEAALARVRTALDWLPQVARETCRHQTRDTQVLRLQPTPRSRLRG